MRTLTRVIVSALTAGVWLVATDAASAQVLGTFRWQLAPFCNVVSLRVEQKDSIYELSGTENRCGQPVAAAATGSAHLNPNGTITLAFTVIRPDGIPIAHNASIAVATLSGTWADEYGNSGLFTFNPPSAVGPQRTISLKGNFNIVYHAAAASQDDTSAFSFSRPLPSAPAVPPANIIPLAGPPTANCPGTFDNPQALPGQLCIYERVRGNAAIATIVNSSVTINTADPTGATAFVRSAAAGQAFWAGKWVVTLPQ